MKTVLTCKEIRAEETTIGEGVILIIGNLTPPIIKLLKEKYLEDNTCLKGDIKALLEAKGSGRGSDDYLYR